MKRKPRYLRPMRSTGAGLNPEVEATRLSGISDFETQRRHIAVNHSTRWKKASKKTLFELLQSQKTDHETLKKVVTTLIVNHNKFDITTTIAVQMAKNGANLEQIKDMLYHIRDVLQSNAEKMR